MTSIRKDELEIFLDRNLNPFPNPKVELEQYATPAKIVASLMHFAHLQGDVEGKTVVDLCSGTGAFAIAAALKGARTVYAVEFDSEAIATLEENIRKLEVDVNIVHADAREWNPSVEIDTVFLNPPFGIRQKEFKDSYFVVKGFEYAKSMYAIVDGVKKNIVYYSNLAEKYGWTLMGHYSENFDLPATLSFHKKRKMKIPVLILQFVKEK